MARLHEMTNDQLNPVEAVAINKYIVNNGLMNALEFSRNGSNIGGMLATVINTYAEPEIAKARAIGAEYDEDTHAAVPVTLLQTLIGKKSKVDRAQMRAFSKDAAGYDRWSEAQVRQNINATVAGFNKMFLQGNKTLNQNEFDGLGVFFQANPGQVSASFSLTDLTENNAIAVERYLNETLAKVYPAPNVILTSRLKGKPFLSTLETYRHRGFSAVKIGDREYTSYMGIPIIEVEDAFFGDAANEFSVIFANFSEDEGGIRVVIPDDQVIYIDVPTLENDNQGGKAVKEIEVELQCVPVIVDPFCAAKAVFLKAL